MFFFDLDGTLLDSTQVWLDIDTALLGRHGISPVPADYTDYVTHHSAPDSAQYTKDRFGLSESPQEIMDAWSGMAKIAYGQTLALKPGAKAFLQQCAQSGIRMAILTSCFPELCRAALEHHGIDHFFEAVLTTMETGLEKRDGALYRLAAEICGIAPDKCTLFEDNPRYCAAAKQTGFQIVGIQDVMFQEQQDALRQLCAPGHYLTDFEGVSPDQL